MNVTEPQTTSRTSEHNPTCPFKISRCENPHATLQFDVASRLSHYEIIWITHGRVRLTADLNTVETSDQIIFCLLPGQLRTLNSVSPCKGYYISFHHDFLSLPKGQTEFSAFTSRHFNPYNLLSLRPDVELAREMEDVVQKMFKEFSNLFSLRSEILKGLLKVLVIYLTRNLKGEHQAVSNTRDIEMVNRFLELVQVNFKTMKKVSWYADELCVTPNYLNQMVKRVSGFPASHHIQQEIVLEAKRQASHTGLRMKEIANSLGFHDYAHFSKFFKSYSGVSFSNFKNGLAQ